MLVLSRLAGQTICIGDNIRVTVLRTQGNKVQLGIEASKDIPVRRVPTDKKAG